MDGLLGVIAIVSCIVGAHIGAKKGEGGIGMILGFLLGPLGVLIVALSSGKTKECPFCRERIHNGAIVCRYCHKTVQTPQSSCSANALQRVEKPVFDPRWEVIENTEPRDNMA